MYNQQLFLKVLQGDDVNEKENDSKIFKIPIAHGDKYHQKGVQQASELAFQYWFHFEGFGTNTINLI